MVTGKGLEIHHLIEQRFIGLFKCKTGEMPSIVLTEEEHQIFTNAWRSLVGYSNSNNNINTLTASVDDVWSACQRIYADYPDILAAIKQFIDSFAK
jgi:hypothetical protein